MKKSLYSRIIPIGSNFIVRRKGHWGIVDVDDNQLLPMEYTRVHWFDDDYAGIQINNKWGLVDRNGNITIDPQYDAIKYYSQYNGCEVEIGKSMYVVDVNNNVILRKNNGNVFLYGNKLLVCANRKRQLFNYDGTPFSREYSDVTEESGVFVCEDEENDKTIKYIVTPEGTEVRLPDGKIGYYCDEITYFKYQDKYGIINDKGEIVVPNKYNYITLGSGVIAVKIGDLSKDKNRYFRDLQDEGEWCLWNYQFEEITGFRYDQIRSDNVNEGKVWFAKREGIWYRITPTGEVLFAETDELFNQKKEAYVRKLCTPEKDSDEIEIYEDDKYRGDDRKLFVVACDGKKISHYYYTPYLPDCAGDLMYHWKIGESFVNKYGQDMPNLHAFKLPKRKLPRYIFKLDEKLTQLNDKDMMELFVLLTKRIGWSEQQIINMYAVMDSHNKKAIYCDWLLRKMKRNKDFKFSYDDIGDFIVAVDKWTKRRSL